MARLFFISIFFSALIFSQKEKVNIKDIFQNNGIYYNTFSEEVVNGMVYQFNDDLELPLGIIINGFKEGKWLEWAGENKKIKTSELLLKEKEDLKKNHHAIAPSILEISNYISDNKYNKAVLRLIFTQVINFDSAGSKMEESLKTYNEIGILKRKTYRKYQYFKESSGMIYKIKIFNDKNILIQQQLLNYDKNKMLIDKELIGIEDEIIDKTIYSYNSLGLLEKKINYDKTGEKNNSITINYDKVGNKNKELVQLFSRKSNFDISIENYYTYDQNGNIVKKENQHYITYYYYNDQILLAEEVTYLINSTSKNDRNVILSKKIYNYY